MIGVDNHLIFTVEIADRYVKEPIYASFLTLFKNFNVVYIVELL